MDLNSSDDDDEEPQASVAVGEATVVAEAEEADEEAEAVAENAGEEAAEKEAGEECKEADEEEEQEEEEVEVEEEAEAETEAGEPQTSLAVWVAAAPRPTRSNTAPSTTLLQLGDHNCQLASEPSPPRPRPASIALTVTWRAGDRVHARYGARLVAKQYTRWFPGAIR